MSSEKFVTLKKITTKLGNNIELIGFPNDKDSSQFTAHSSLVIGVFHGDEPQGKFLIKEYLNSPSPLPSPQRGEGAEPSPYSSLQMSNYNHKHNYTEFAKIKSKELRKNCTDAEQKLWNILRRNQLHGLHFKRQKPIGNYIADFVCTSKKLIIEIDGGQHNELKNIIYDKNRTAYFKDLGYKVIRFWNNDVLQNIEGVVSEIENSLSPRGRGLGRGASVLFIPCLNPDGMALGTRTNANGVDLNRNFPTKNWGEDTSQAGNNPSDYFGGKSAGSEIETQFLMEIIEEYKPEKILTLHAPYKVVNYDGPAREWAESISKIINYPVEESIGYPTPGSFGTYAGIERNIPVITLELDEKIPPEQLIPPVFEIFDNL